MEIGLCDQVDDDYAESRVDENHCGVEQQTSDVQSRFIPFVEIHNPDNQSVQREDQ